MSEDPQSYIRYLPEQIAEQLKNAQSKNIRIFEEMPKHYLIVGVKG